MRWATTTRPSEPKIYPLIITMIVKFDKEIPRINYEMTSFT